MPSILQGTDITCPATGFQPATVCVPVTVTPFAHAMPTTTFCCGDPVVTPGATSCPGTVNGSCHFTISQRICVKVPVEFGANSSVGAPSVQCENATSEDVCTNCGAPGVTSTSAYTAKTCATCKG